MVLQARLARLPGTAALVGVVTSSAALAAQPATPPLYPDKYNLMIYVDESGRAQPVRTATDWRVRRVHILQNMQLVMGGLSDAARRVPLAMAVHESIDTCQYVLKRVTYAAEPEDRVPAYLLVPKGVSGKAPAMLCLHQTLNFGDGKEEPAGTLPPPRGDPSMYYAKRLAQRGYVTIAPDYPGFGDYDAGTDCEQVYAKGYASVTMKGIWNHMRAVDLLRSLPEVDGERVGVIGHSLGGYNALFLAAFDERLKVVVSSCGFTSFARYSGSKIGRWAARRFHMPRIQSVYGSEAARMPFEFSEVIAAIAPRALFVNAPEGDEGFSVDGVRDCLNAAEPVYGLLGVSGNLVAVHPPGGHSFPAEVRRQAYAFVDRVLRDGLTPAERTSTAPSTPFSDRRERTVDR